jgi:hypothetical protein
VSRLWIELSSDGGRAESIEIGIRRDTVEMRWAGRNVADVGREELLAWLTSQDAGERMLCTDEVMWTRDDPDGITLVVAGSGSWLLDLAALGELRRRL